MRGINFFTTTAALAASKGGFNKHTSVDIQEPFGRREALQTMILGAAVLAPTVSNALDMDAFMNSELESDTKNCDPKRDAKCLPKLTPDEAMCQYGQTGDKKTEACKRVKAVGGNTSSGKKQGKSIGGAYAM